MSQESHHYALMQQLKNYFQLERVPFSEESHFFFSEAQRQHNVEALRHLATFGDMVLFLTGEKGSGKTSVLMQLQEDASDDLRIVYLDCESLVKDAQNRQGSILLSCQSKMGLAPEGDDLNTQFDSIIQACESFRLNQGLRTLVALDNADKLPKQQLLALCAYYHELSIENAACLLFAGPVSLLQAARCVSNQDQDPWWHQIQLKPFSQEEIGVYLQQALGAAGFDAKLELTDQQLLQVAQVGKGLPGRINKIFSSVLLEPGTLKIAPKKNKKHLPLQLFFGVAFLLIISFLLVSYQYGLFDQLDTPTKSLSQETKVSIFEEELEQRQRLDMLNEALKKQGMVMPESAEAVIAVQEVQNIETQEESADTRFQLRETDISDSEDYGIAISGSSEGQSEQAADETVDMKTQSDEPSQPVDKEQQSFGVKNEKKPKPLDKPPAFRSKEWLEVQAKDAYMTQILGSYDEKTALKFIDELGKPEFEIYYLEAEHKGKPWFVVFYGIHSSKKLAQDAVSRAPKRIQDQTPWIRRSQEVLSSYPKTR